MLGDDELLVAVPCERHFTHLQLLTLLQIFLRYRDMQRWETGGAAVMTQYFRPSFLASCCTCCTSTSGAGAVSYCGYRRQRAYTSDCGRLRASEVGWSNNRWQS